MNTNFYSQNYTTSLPNGDFFSGGGEMEPVKAQESVVATVVHCIDILSCIKSSQSSLGISRQELYNALRSQMVQRKVDEGLDLLASEGYIYTTMDHDHFRHIEA